jgi:putative SOS response-associated peptidase YedK
MIAISYSLASLIEPTSEWIRSFVIITTTPIELCAALHDRMPVVLGRQNRPAWLDEEPADPPDVNARQTGGVRSRA